MTTNQPVELGRVSEETKQIDFGSGDNSSNPHGELGA
jgi:hypothetical protein